MKLRALLLGMAILLPACRPWVGEFTATAYRHPTLEYGVHYADAKEQALMPDSWRLDNLYTTERGWKSKTGADYVSTLHLDSDGDGETNDLGERPTFDLRFVHNKNGSVIALRTLLTTAAGKETDLRVRVEGLAANLAGGESRVVQLEGELRATTSDDRYATRIVSGTKGKLAGRDAYAATIDVVNVDQHRIDPDHIETRLLVVLARTGLTHRAGGADLPVLMLATYASSPREFQTSFGDFDDLLSRIEIDGKRGFKLERRAPEKPASSAVAPEQKVDETPPTPSPDPADAGSD